MRPRLLTLCAAAVLAVASQVLYPGCATMDAGSSTAVRVKSRPAGANVFVDGRLAGTTPVTTSVSRWGFHKLRIEATGFEPMEMPLVKSLNGNATGNLFFPPGILIDLASGAIFQVDLPEKMPPGASRGHWEKGDSGTWASLIVMAELRPQQHGAQIGKLKRK